MSESKEAAQLQAIMADKNRAIEEEIIAGSPSTIMEEGDPAINEIVNAAKNLEDFPANSTGCACGIYEHKKLDSFIVCIFCGRLCHKECVRPVSQQLPDVRGSKPTIAYSWKEYLPYFPITNVVPPASLCVCRQCAKEECFVDSNNCSVTGCTNPLMIHKKHVCITCNKPVHFGNGCCTYIEGVLSDSLPPFWNIGPKCKVCCHNEEHHMQARQTWLQPHLITAPELLFPCAMTPASLEQAMNVILTTRKRKIKKNNKHAFKNWKEQPFEPLDRFRLANTGKEKRQSPRAISSLDYCLLSHESVCTPNLVELWICAISEYEELGTRDAVNKEVMLLQLGMSSEMMDCYKSGGNKLESFYKSSSPEFRKHFKGAKIIFIPIFQNEYDYVLGVVTTVATEQKVDVTCCVHDYSSNVETKYHVLAVAALKSFIDTIWRLEATPDNEVVIKCASSFARPHQISKFDGGTRLCLDVKALVTRFRGRGRQSTFSIVDNHFTLNQDRETSDSYRKKIRIFVELLKKVVSMLRNEWAELHVSKLTYFMDKVVENQFVYFKQLEQVLILGKQLFMSMGSTNNNELEPVIGCCEKSTLQNFMDVFLPCITYEETDVYDTENGMCSFVVNNVLEILCPGCRQNYETSVCNFAVDIPRRTAFEKWQRYISLTPLAARHSSYQKVQHMVSCFPLTTVSGSYASLTDYFQYRNVQTELFPFNKLCFWELTTVSMIAQVLLHDRGHHEIESGVRVCLSDGSSLERGFDDHQQCRKLPEGTKSVICMVYEGTHNSVFEVRIASRQVVVYDGQDGTPKLLAKSKGSSSLVCPAESMEVEGIEDAADEHWHLHAFRLLKMLQLIETDDISELKIASLDSTIVRETDVACQGGEKWQIVTPPILYKHDWRERLICQNDGFSCGRIAILHLLKLLGEDIKIHYDDDPMKCIPHTETLTLDNLSRPNWKELIGKWLRDSMGSPTESDLLECYEFYNHRLVEDQPPLAGQDTSHVIGILEQSRQANQNEAVAVQESTSEVEFVPVHVDVEIETEKGRFSRVGNCSMQEVETHGVSGGGNSSSHFLPSELPVAPVGGEEEIEAIQGSSAVDEDFEPISTFQADVEFGWWYNRGANDRGANDRLFDNLKANITT